MSISLKNEEKLMKKITIDKLATKILQLRQRVIEIKGMSVFEEVNKAVKHPKVRRLKDVKALENQ
jgi:hypothetical protein